MNARKDAVVIGGGHNGLVAAAYLANSGLGTLVCEQREVLGGAAVSEHPFGPDFTVTSLSYVVSLLPPDLVARPAAGPARLPRVPPGPVLRAPRRRPLPAAALRPRRAARRDRQVLRRRRRRLRGVRGSPGPAGRHPGPLLDEIPPRLGSRRPPDLWRQGLLLRHLRKVDTRGAVDITRLLTGSIADLVERYFESDAMRGLLSVSGVIGTWAGPRSAGTAYVMLHHHIGDTGGQAGAWGFPRGGHGRRDRGAGRVGPVVRRGDVHGPAPVARIRTRSAAGSPG